jgi:hypothetical protein
MSRRHGLQRFAGPPGSLLEQRSALMRQLEQCEMCRTPVAARHGHVVDTKRRSLLCACRACFLLFTKGDARRSRYLAVPERHLCDPLRPVSVAEWDGLDIPVNSAFVLRTGAVITAFHPSPAGATERALSPGFWAEFAATHPLVAAAEPDVEAILFRRGEDEVDCFLVPIDVCYRLVGTVRLYWSGMDGGDQVRDHIDELFAEIRDKAGVLAGGAR